MGFKSLGPPRQIASGWIAFREGIPASPVSAPIGHGGRRPAALRQGDSAIAVDFARALRGLPSYKARDGLRCLRPARDGSNRGGLGREIMCRAVANLNPAADLSRSASLPFLCALFLQRTRTEMP